VLVSDSVVRTWRAPATRPSSGWLLRPWPNDPSARLLVFVDHLSVPTADAFAAAIAEARRSGAETVRTSALFPRAADVALDNGFVEIDTLCLLRLSLDDALDQRLEARFGLERPATRALRSWNHQAAASLDQEAFGAVWGNDAASLADIRRATPNHRARMIRRQRRMVGFAISGSGGQSGYIQRLAVASTERRHGLGVALVVDSLRWMRRGPLATAYVNTGFDNVAALTLYEQLGFERMADQLTIVEHRSRP
jgi:ribosomal protein S18 acetylase RimI-like enzyme